ncbi:hypothetical protein ACVNPS_06185 [Candidatus Bipolaricaulota sp. J31]
MRRKLFLILSLFPVVVWGQAFGGRWSGEISFLPSVALNATSLEVSYSFLEGWRIIATGDFLGTDGWVWQEFDLSGEFSFADVELLTLFGPQAPAFLYSQLSTSFSIAGLDIDIYSAYVSADIPGVYFSGGPSGGAVISVATQVDGLDVELELGFGARLTDPDSPFTITYTGVATSTKMYLVDPFPGGLEFTYLELSLTDIPFLCCGITLDFTFSFGKEEGFEYAKFALNDLFTLCCDIAFGIEVTLGVDYKEVTPRFTWGGLEACVTVYGDIVAGNALVEAWELYGFKVTYELEGCYGAEFLTAFDVAAVEGIVGDIFEGDEFEYVKLTTCGPACCDGTWNLGITVYFQEVAGPLFGISRLVVEVEVPLLHVLTVSAAFEMAIPGGPSLDLGWELSF